MLKKNKPLSIGDLVRIRSHQTSSDKCNPGNVVKQCEEPISYIVKSRECTFSRNRMDLLRTKETKNSRSFAVAGKGISSCRSNTSNI